MRLKTGINTDNRDFETDNRDFETDNWDFETDNWNIVSENGDRFEISRLKTKILRLKTKRFRDWIPLFRFCSFKCSSHDILQLLTDNIFTLNLIYWLNLTYDRYCTYIWHSLHYY